MGRAADTVDRIEAAGERGERVDQADIDAVVRLSVRIMEMVERRREAWMMTAGVQPEARR